jgi:pre-60S factor REI1
LCAKQYSSEQAYKQHLLTKQHIKKAATAPEGTAAFQAKIRPAPVRAPAENGAEARKEVEKDEDEDSDWEEVDAEILDVVDEDMAAGHERRGEESTSMEEDGPDWDPTHCLFCGKDHKGDVEACVAHMHSAHGFFVPDLEFVKDLTGILQYLGFKVWESVAFEWESLMRAGISGSGDHGGGHEVLV